ncbi:MAG: imidazole glycerol phosphate synthase subunit HisH [Woeseiaceae bacterium]|nr:imidazole glycerol phosphate synthase subunit HisH [Woeseiaceae bacterium]
MAAVNVAIVDSGGANIASLSNALERLGVDSRLTRDTKTIRNASHVILPGVGAAADAMQKLKDNELCEVVAGLEQPVLGICLGMQLLAEASAEDDTRCLGVVPGVAEKLRSAPGSPVPNMGWCRVRQTLAHALFTGIADNSYFYFVHSYALPPDGCTIATASHSSDFSAAFAKQNYFAVQFHPERSAGAGARFLQNFVGLAA